MLKTVEIITHLSVLDLIIVLYQEIYDLELYS